MTEPLRILILEDNPADAELAQFELREAGFTFTPKVVTTGEDFARELQDFAPDLILSDYDLPKYNGALALAEARKQRPETPFILVTGAVTEDRAIDILTQGAKDYVLKNRLEQRLVPAIRRSLAEVEEHRARKKAEEDLREAHENLESLVDLRTTELKTVLDAAPIAIWIAHDPECKVITGNAYADQMIMKTSHRDNISRSAAPGEAAVSYKVFHDGAELKPEEMPAQLAAATGKPVMDMEVELVFSDGRHVHLIESAMPLFDPDGRVRGAVITGSDVSKLKQSETAFRHSEERQRLVLRASSMGTFEVDLLTGEGQCNATEFELLGLRPGAIVASPDTFFRFVHPDDVGRLRDQWTEAMRSGKLDAEFRIVRADGQERWLAGKGQFSSDGKPGGMNSGTRRKPLRFMGVNFDITERKKAEEAAAVAQGQIQGIIDNATAIIYALDLEERFLLVNTAVARLLNTTPEQMIGKRRHEFMPKDDADWHEANDRRVLEAGKALEFEEHSRLKDRSIVWLTTKFPLRDAQGRIYAVAGISADISGQKQAQERLRESEERYRGVVENTTAIILRVDPSGVINFANSRALEFFGYTADELIGRHAVGTIIPARESSGRDLAVMVDQITAYPDRFHSNANENICKDGRRVWLEWTNSGIYSADGRLMELLCVGIDATVAKQAEETLKLHAAIMETVADGIFLVGLEDNIIKWTNRKFDQLFGYGPGEMVGMHVDKINAPTERTPTETRISIVDVLRQAGEWHGEIENIKKDGTHFWCRIHVSLFDHPEFGTVMVSAHTDITGHKMLQGSLQRSEKM